MEDNFNVEYVKKIMRNESSLYNFAKLYIEKLKRLIEKDAKFGHTETKYLINTYDENFGYCFSTIKKYFETRGFKTNIVPGNGIDEFDFFVISWGE